MFPFSTMFHSKKLKRTPQKISPKALTSDRLFAGTTMYLNTENTGQNRK